MALHDKCLNPLKYWRKVDSSGQQRFMNFGRSLLPCLVTFTLLFVLLASASNSNEIDNSESSQPVRVDFSLLREPTVEKPLQFEIELTIEDGYYVYSEPDYSFGFEVLKQQGLATEAELALPETESIPDILSSDPDAETEVFASDTKIQVEIPSSMTSDDDEWGMIGRFTWQACTDEICLPPDEAMVEFGQPPAQERTVTETVGGTGIWGDHNLIWGAVAAFLAGIALSLTPCVYPMIGITVAVIGGNTTASRGRTLWLTFVYVFGLSLVYALAGVGVSFLGAQAAGFMRSTYVLIFVGAVFILMALSLFDVFSINMPVGLQAKLQGMGGNGSTGGVFVMGAVSAFLVGSCISGPLISLITFVAVSGNPLIGFVYFFALAWGMGILLFIAGIASGTLPRAGAWMQKVKHILGVVLLWAAFYFIRPVTGETIYYAAVLTLLGVALAFTGLPKFLDAYSSSPGRRRKLQVASFAALAILLSVNFLIVRKIAQNPHHFGTEEDYRVELQEELAQGQTVMLEFWAPWCAICLEIEREVLQDPDIERILAENNVRVVKVHYDYNPELNQKFDLVGPPAFIFLDPDGNRLTPVIVAKEEIRQAIEDKAWKD